MDVDEIRCKFQRGDNGDGRLEQSGGEIEKMEEEEEQYQDEGEEGGSKLDITAAAAVGRFYGWPSSRIVRVSRASGGKDRHSKVLTSKGLRDRRVRLSVNTAIQFYDLQDRLGYDQPSKAVEWLLKAAASSIAELPPISSPFSETPNQVSDEKRSSTGGSDQLGFDSAEAEIDGGGDPSFSQQFATKSSACSSASETSKGSFGISLSRSESRIKARERAKERVAEKEKENSMNNNPISHTTSFTELLSGGISAVNNNNTSSPIENPTASAAANESSFFMKHSTSQMDYFCSGLLAPPSARQMQIGGNHFAPMFGLAAAAEHQSELQQYSFVPDHLVHQVVNGGGDYNLSFSVSSSANSSGFNRGTLQSNSSSSPSMLPHNIQRFSDGSPANFFATVDNHNHHQFMSGYDAAAAAARHSSQRGGKGKN